MFKGTVEQQRAQARRRLGEIGRDVEGSRELYRETVKMLAEYPPDPSNEKSVYFFGKMKECARGAFRYWTVIEMEIACIAALFDG
jgi:hypothetical protein